jgi:hypothetical protein
VEGLGNMSDKILGAVSTEEAVFRSLYRHVSAQQPSRYFYSKPSDNH